MGIRIQTDHRTTIIGGTGDGKTTLALKLMAQIATHSRQATVIVNPGAEDKLYDTFGEARPDIDPTWPDIQHVAPYPTKKLEQYDKLWQPIVQHGNVLTYLDEIFSLATANSYGLWLQWLYQAGRRRNCGVVGITQRPRTIPVFVINMSDHLFVGDVRGDDLKHLESLTSQPWRDAIQQRGEFEFLYWSKWVKEAPKVVRL